MSPSTGASARRAGHEFERQVARFLDTRTTRNFAPGAHIDSGDLVVPGWVVECKNIASPSQRQVLGWHIDATNKALAADITNVAVVVKARNRPIGESRVHMTPTDLYALITGERRDFTKSLVTVSLYLFRDYLTIQGVLT